MTTIIDHADARIQLEEVSVGTRRIFVQMKDAQQFVSHNGWETAYPQELIERILAIKGPAWVCDEIMREEDDTYVASHLRYAMLSYVEESAMEGKRLLDFGCGSGASTMILSRLFPSTQIVGVELEQELLGLARARACHYQTENVECLLSPCGDALPVNLGQFDLISLSAVYEHLLPSERKVILQQLWEHLKPGGILFINQTPDIKFPIETHTTGLPLINYLPDRLAHTVIRRLSRRVDPGWDWNTLLRAGIRGSTVGEILHTLRAFPEKPNLLRPARLGVRQQSDIWYYASETRMKKRWSGLKKRIVYAAMKFLLFSRIPVAPYLSLAIQKCART